MSSIVTPCRSSEAVRTAGHFGNHVRAKALDDLVECALNRSEGRERNKRERSGGVPLCRYIARPTLAISRLSLSSTGKVVYTLKTPYPD